MAGVDSDRLAQQAAEVIERGSRSFAVATRLFEPSMRRDVMLLYTWCRHCDDLIDGQQLGQGTITTASTAMLEQLRAKSLDALAGDPSDELPFLALADLCRRHPVKRSLIEAHLRGFELDVIGWQPQTLDDTVQYCYHTAGTVGIMMANLMDIRDTTTLYRASDLGIGFQLTNIARDVVEDAAAGRCYLPAEWRQSAGLEISDLPNVNQHARLFPLVRRLIDEAEPYYQSAAIGLRALPRRAAWAVATARSVYRDIGHKLVRRGPDALGERTYTGASRKAWRVVATVPTALAPRRTLASTSRSALWTPPEIA